MPRKMDGGSAVDYDFHRNILTPERRTGEFLQFEAAILHMFPDPAEQLELVTI